MKSKYKAIRTEVDGITFASKAEARRYGELKLLERAGEIGIVRCQISFPLHVCGIKIGSYIADFGYWKDGERIIEDVKGFATPLYRWKKKHFETEHGLKIVEIRK